MWGKSRQMGEAPVLGSGRYYQHGQEAADVVDVCSNLLSGGDNSGGLRRP